MTGWRSAVVRCEYRPGDPTGVEFLSFDGHPYLHLS